MAESEKAINPKPEKTKTKPTGRKGGTIFPRIALKEALTYAKKLVSKTAVGPQPEQTILAGVFGNAGGPGKIRLSALKQFGLLEGTPAAYKATQLAKDIEAAPDDTARQALFRRAVLSPKVYREVFNTHHGDIASRAKVRGRALALEVHPDVGDTFTGLFIESALTAGLATAEGDDIRLISATDAVQPPAQTSADEDDENAETGDEDDTEALAREQEEKVKKDPLAANNHPNVQDDTGSPARPRQRAADITLNLTVDSSLDGEKLEKQLALLRRFGLI